MKKFKKLSILLVILLFAGTIFYFADGILGNPVTKFVVTKSANKYLEKNYTNQDLKVDSVFYNFKFSEYCARIVSETSVDTHFELNYTRKGKFRYDTYDMVENGWNTYERLQVQYRDMVDAVFEDPSFPFASNIDFGELRLLEKSKDDFDTLEYGIDLSTLVRDQEYDIKELAKSAGHLTCYAKDKEVTAEKTGELLILLKQKFDEMNVPFYAINFVLEEDNGMRNRIRMVKE